eukprot:s3889_g1.t1
MVARELARYPVARLRMKNTSQCDGVSGKGFAGAACKMSAYGTAWRRQKEEAGAECRSHFLAMRQRVSLVVCSESCKGLGPWKADGIEREMRMAGSFLTHFWCSMSTLDARSSRPGKACSLLQTHSVVDLLGMADEGLLCNLVLFFCFTAGYVVEERNTGMPLLLDAHVITDGLAAPEARLMPLLGFLTKSLREANFPTLLAQKADWKLEV